MKKISLFIALILLFSLFSLPDTQDQSIEALINKSSKSNPKEKIELFIRIAKKYRVKNRIADSIDFAQKAVDLSKNLQLKSSELEALRQIVYSYNRNMNYKQSLTYAMRLYQLSQNYKSVTDEIGAGCLLSEIYGHLKSYRNAEIYGEKAMALALKLDNKELITSALYYLNRVYIKQKNIKKIRKYFIRKKEIVKRIPETSVMHLYHFDGTNYLQLNDAKAAMDTYEVSVNLLKKHKNHSLALHTMSYNGHAYLIQERYHEGIRYLLEGVDYYSALKKKDFSIEKAYGRILDKLGDLYLYGGNQKQAEKRYLQLMDHAIRIENDWLLKISYGELIDMYVQIGQFENAEVYIKKFFKNPYKRNLIAHIEQWDNDIFIFQCQMELKRGKYDKALVMLKKALDCALKYEQIKEASLVCQLMAKAHLGNKQLKLARHSLDSSIQYAQNYNKGLLLHDNKILKENYKIYASLFNQLGDKANATRYARLYERTVENLNKFVKKK